MKLLIELDEEYVKAIDKIKFLVGGRTDRSLQLEIIKAIKNGKALEQEPRWIPVSERLPTKEEYIANNGLFIVSDGNRTCAEYFDVYNSMKCFGEPTMNGFRVDRCVTAWMPLPESYKGESEKK